MQTGLSMFFSCIKAIAAHFLKSNMRLIILSGRVKAPALFALVFVDKTIAGSPGTNDFAFVVPSNLNKVDSTTMVH